jgi:hypothetical protein
MPTTVLFWLMPKPTFVSDGPSAGSGARACADGRDRTQVVAQDRAFLVGARIVIATPAEFITSGRRSPTSIVIPFTDTWPVRAAYTPSWPLRSVNPATAS